MYPPTLLLLDSIAIIKNKNYKARQWCYYNLQVCKCVFSNAKRCGESFSRQLSAFLKQKFNVQLNHTPGKPIQTSEVDWRAFLFTHYYIFKPSRTNSIWRKHTECCYIIFQLRHPDCIAPCLCGQSPQLTSLSCTHKRTPVCTVNRTLFSPPVFYL